MRRSCFASRGSWVRFPSSPPRKFLVATLPGTFLLQWIALRATYVTVYPCGSRPDASNLNFVSGQTIPNSVIAPVSANGEVCFYVYGTAHLLADVSGCFAF